MTDGYVLAMAQACDFVVSLVTRSLFFYSYYALQDLHSFPTRRSSDPPREDPQRVRDEAPVHDLDVLVDVRLVAPAVRLREEAVVRGRSEEHTSELQSRVDLVCRLLLEKKK